MQISELQADKLEGLKEIANHLGILALDPRKTIDGWRVNQGLPIRQVKIGNRNVWIGSKKALTKWYANYFGMPDWTAGITPHNRKGDVQPV